MPCQNKVVVSFTCNICGAHNQVEKFETEPASCGCGSNVRVRALIHLLSMELFGLSLPLTEFPRLKAIRGLGMTDKEGYSVILAEKFDYTNTFYDREPRFDFTEAHSHLAGAYDFVLSADVLEHIAPPVDRALHEVCRLLKPNGFLVATVYCNPADELREHFPGLHDFRVISLGSSVVLVNRSQDGVLSVRDDLIFHGGSGATLEMREFGATCLRRKLLGSGFQEIHFLSEEISAIGILFDSDVSQPLVARKEPFVLSRWAQAQLLELWRAAQDRQDQAQSELIAERAQRELLLRDIRTATDSKWLRLGKTLGLGPKLPGQS